MAGSVTGLNAMKKYIVPLSAAAGVAVFFLGYYAGNSRVPLQQQEEAALSEAAKEDNRIKQQDLSTIKEESVKNAESQIRKKVEPSVPSAADTASPEPKKQTRKELIASLRKQGIPKEDVERVADALTKLTGEGAAPDEAAELTAEQQADIAASVQAAGVPEEDAARVAKALGPAALSEVPPEKSHEEMKAEAAASAREAGVPEEDVERVAESLAGSAPKKEAISEQIDEEQAKKKAAVAANVKESGVPEEDVERVTNALTEGGASPTQATSPEQ